MFSRDRPDDLPDLWRLDRVLSRLPDGELLDALRARRGRGRNEYPVAALWRWVDENGVARIVHAPMRRLVPGEWVFSRLMVNLVKLEEDRRLLSALVDRLRDSLMVVLPDYGEHLGVDGKALESHSTGRVNRRGGEASDRDADWGHHSTDGVD